MKLSKILLSLLLVGTMLLFLTTVAFAQEVPVAPASGDGQEKTDLRDIEEHPTRPDFDGLYMDFDSEADLEGWSFRRMETDEMGMEFIYVNDPPVFWEASGRFSGMMGLNTQCAAECELSYNGNAEYTIRPEDQFSIYVEPIFYGTDGWGGAFVKITVDGTTYKYDLGEIYTARTVTTEPLGISGKLEKFEVWFVDGFFLQAKGISIGCVSIGVDIEDGEEITDKGVSLNHSLNIANDISLNYLVPEAQLAGYDMDTVSLSVSIPSYEGNECIGSTTETLYPQYRDGYYYFVLDGLTAVQMNDTLEAQLHGTKMGRDYCSEADTYSVATYAMNQLNKSEAKESLKSLCANLLRYGAKAQEFKEYRTDTLADSAMTEQQRSYLTDLGTVVFANNYLELNDEYETGFAWTGKGLNLGTRVGVTFRMEKLDETLSDGDWSVVIRYRNIKGELITYTVDSSQITADGKEYSFEFSELAATELRTTIAVTVYGAEGKAISKTLVYSPDTYGNGKTELLGDVCKALFAYSDSAKVFFVG